MIKHLVRCVLLSLSFSAATSFAGDVEADFAKLSTIPAKYKVFGTICEYLTKIRLEDKYPTSEYTIEVGVEYRFKGRVVGEIDVIVFRNSDMEAISVGQVKCSKSFTSARTHANEQNRRFTNLMWSGPKVAADVTFRSTSKSSLTILSSQMDEVEEYFTAAQEGGTDYGFTMSVGHDIDAVSKMRDRLLACQEQGLCPLPL